MIEDGRSRTIFMQLSTNLKATSRRISGRSSGVEVVTSRRAGAVLLSVWVVYVLHDYLLLVAPGDLRNALGVVAGASATILGFLVSAGALLYAVANTRLARNLQRTN